jgi:MFS family permease
MSPDLRRDRFPRTILPAAAALVSLFVFALSTSLLPAALLRASADLSVSPQALAAVSSAQFAAFVLVAAFFGFLSDRWGKQRVFLGACALLSEHHSYERTIAVLLGFSGITLALQGLAGGWRSSIAFFSLSGLVLSGSWPLLVALAFPRRGRRTGPARRPPPPQSRLIFRPVALNPCCRGVGEGGEIPWPAGFPF